MVSPNTEKTAFDFSGLGNGSFASRN